MYIIYTIRTITTYVYIYMYIYIYLRNLLQKNRPELGWGPNGRCHLAPPQRYRLDPEADGAMFKHTDA